MNAEGLLLVAVGIFALCGAGFSWEWFMNHRKALFLTEIFGREGTRVFYGLIGAGLVVLGTLITMGVVHSAR